MGNATPIRKLGINQRLYFRIANVRRAQGDAFGAPGDPGQHGQRFMTRLVELSPGDVVWLGTDDKPHNMKVGDMLEIEISGIGLLRNQVVAETPGS